MYYDEDYNRPIKCLPSENITNKGIKVFIFSVAMKYFMWCILDTLKTIPELFFLNLKLKYIIQFLIQSNMQIMYYAFAQVWKSRLSMHRDQVHQIQWVWYSDVYYTIKLLSKNIRYNNDISRLIHQWMTLFLFTWKPDRLIKIQIVLIIVWHLITINSSKFEEKII